MRNNTVYRIHCITQESKQQSNSATSNSGMTTVSQITRQQLDSMSHFIKQTRHVPQIIRNIKKLQNVFKTLQTLPFSAIKISKARWFWMAVSLRAFISLLIKLIGSSVSLASFNTCNAKPFILFKAAVVPTRKSDQPTLATEVVRG